VAYASGSLALASLEYFVNLDPQDAPPDLVSIRVELAVDQRTVDPGGTARLFSRSVGSGTKVSAFRYRLLTGAAR
jgi:hypothetical protein